MMSSFLSVASAFLYWRVYPGMYLRGLAPTPSCSVLSMGGPVHGLSGFGYFLFFIGQPVDASLYWEVCSKRTFGIYWYAWA